MTSGQALPATQALHAAGQAADKRPNIIAAGFGLLALLVFTVLYIARRDVYFTVIDWWSFRPFRYPFIDLVYIPAQISCWNMGIDVYAENPCDPLGRLHDYSPLWLRFSFLGHAKSFIDAIGLAMDMMFMLSVLALPRPRRSADYCPLLLALISPMTVFAMERGNIDTVMFLFAVAAIVCMDRSLFFRLVGYGGIMLASLLKFYPFVLFILLLRERFRIFLLTAATAICAMGGFIWFYRDELRRMAANIPQPSSFTDAFGAAQLPAGIGILSQRLLGPGGRSAGGLSVGIEVGLSAAVLLIAITFAVARKLSHRQDFRLAMLALTDRESLSLVAGAVLVFGCFLTGRSIGYREIMILLTLPGLSALSRTAPTETIARLFRFTTWNAVSLMFSLPPQRLIYNLFGSLASGADSLPGLVFWLLREICWWLFVTVLGALLIRFVTDSQMGLAVAERWLKPRC